MIKAGLVYLRQTLYLTLTERREQKSVLYQATGGSTAGRTMEQRALKNVNNYSNNNIYFYLETSAGQSSNPYLIVVLFFNTRVD